MRWVGDRGWTRLWPAPAAMGLAMLALAGCGGGAAVQVPGGNADRGVAAIMHYGCGTCHVIAGISGANGEVGPSLSGIGVREYIAGRLRNTPDNLMYWIRLPQQVDPGVDMPDMGVTAADARNIAQYLYTLR